MTTRARKYHQAAVAYFIYGIVYLSGALYAARVGLSARAAEAGGTAFFLVGLLLVLLLPPLIWRGFKWFTRVLALLVLVRIGGLAGVLVRDGGVPVPMPWAGTVPLWTGVAAFMAVAGATCWMLARAGWDLPPRRAAS